MLLPLVPLRDVVLFPAVTMPLYVGRAKTVAAVAAAGDGPVMFVAQRQGRSKAPAAADVYEVGTIGVILQQTQFPDGTHKLLVRGDRRAQTTSFHDGDYLRADATERVDPVSDPVMLKQSAEALAQEYARHFDPAATPPRKPTAESDRLVALMQALLEQSDLDAATRLDRLRSAMADQKSKFA